MSAEENKRIGARLRAERKNAGMVVADLAERFRDVAPERVAQRLPKLRDLERTIRGHEAGQHTVGERYRMLYAAALGIPEDDLFGAAAPIRRREVLEIGVAAAAATVAPRIAHHGPVAPELVSYFRHQLPGHYRADMWLGPHMLIPTVDAQTQLIQQLVQAADTPVRRGLLEVGVAYAALLGWLYQDAANLNQSAQWRSAALDMAHRHGSPQLVSYALANKAMHAVDLHDGAAIIDFAEAALANEGRLDPKVKVLALVHLAHGHSFAGDRQSANHALDRAETLVDLVDDEQPWGNACRRTPRYMDIQRATAYGRVGAYAEATRLWDGILGDQPTDFRRDTGVFWARQAAALAAGRDPEPEMVVQIASVAATACGQTGSERLRGELATLPRYAAGWADSRHGRALTEIIATVT